MNVDPKKTGSSGGELKVVCHYLNSVDTVKSILRLLREWKGCKTVPVDVITV